MIEIGVEGGGNGFSYPVHIGSWRDWDLRSAVPALSRGKWAVVADATVWEHWSRDLESALSAVGCRPACLVLSGGERAKTHESVFRVYDFLLGEQIRRDGGVLVFGGGVLGDLVGFAAATYQRGIACVQIPTTLLAMVDSAVGGKTGVNYGGHKNMIGAFHQPNAVLVSPDWLSSLPEREFRAGLAEVIKCGAIRDSGLLDLMEQLDPSRLVRSAHLEEVIARALGVKRDVVAEDERDQGLRHILNFGHTVGHAIEAVTGFQRYLHGEAVGLGMVAAAELSHSHLGLGGEQVARLEALLSRYGLPTRSVGLEVETLLHATHMDKKADAGGRRWVLTPRWGEATVVSQVPEAQVRESIHRILDS